MSPMAPSMVMVTLAMVVMTMPVIMMGMTSTRPH